MNDYKQQNPPQMMNKQPEPAAEKQCFGFTLAVIALIIWSFCAFSCLSAIFMKDLHTMRYPEIHFGMCALGCICSAIFYGKILNNENYLKGKPEITEMWPLVVSFFLRISAKLFALISVGNYEDSALELVAEIILLVICYYMYFGDDISGSCWLCCKPYIFRVPLIMYNQPIYGYPPQGYAPQGYFPQYQQGYPQQYQQGYVPQPYAHQQQQNKI